MRSREAVARRRRASHADEMARLGERLAENAEGELYVDASCIDCDTCRQIAPATFGSTSGGQSFVARQPTDAVTTRRALMALVACPTASIGTVHKLDVKPAAAAFPEHLSDEVYYCGFAAEDSFGAASYLIRRPAGNVLVDSPRAARPLLRRLEELGGVATLFLTHRDDVADHEILARHFGCQRILHARDVTATTRTVERRLEGDDPIPLADDLLAIPVPGHTRGSTALRYGDRFLFSGDHVWWSGERQRLHASRGVCWYSWSEQLRSLEKLLEHPFEWLLPGHGRRRHSTQMRQELAALVTELRRAHPR